MSDSKAVQPAVSEFREQLRLLHTISEESLLLDHIRLHISDSDTLSQLLIESAEYIGRMQPQLSRYVPIYKSVSMGR